MRRGFESFTCLPNLKCLQECAPTDKRFRADLKGLEGFYALFAAL